MLAAGAGVRTSEFAAERTSRPRSCGRSSLAGKVLEAAGEMPLPAGITAHKLRHTFASLLFAIGRDPVYVMQQLGHTDPKFTLRI